MIVLIKHELCCLLGLDIKPYTYIYTFLEQVIKNTNLYSKLRTKVNIDIIWVINTNKIKFINIQFN